MYTICTVLCDLRSNFSAAAIASARQQLTASLPAPVTPPPPANPKRKPTTTAPKPQSDLHSDVRQTMIALDLYQMAVEHNITSAPTEDALRAAVKAVDSAKADDVVVRMRLALQLFVHCQVQLCASPATPHGCSPC